MWYIAPRLAKLHLEEALIPLLWVHVFRYTPLTLFAPGQVDPGLPDDIVATIAYGDLVSGILAFITILFLRFGLPGGLMVAWIFNGVGIADIVLALVRGVGAELYQYELGFNWYILNYYVPFLMVSHGLMVYRLVKRQ